MNSFRDMRSSGDERNKPDIFGDDPYANAGVSAEYQSYSVPRSI